MKTLQEIIHKKPKIEIDNLKSTTELNNATIRRLKFETLRNIIFLLIGAIITLITTKLNSLNEHVQSKSDNKKIIKLNQLVKSNQLHIKKIQLELNKLKKNINESVDLDCKK